MQKINPLLDQTSKKLKTGSSASPIEVGPNRVAEPDDAEYEAAGDMDHVDAINRLFGEFEFSYHNQYHKAFSDPESLVIAKKYWLSCLSQYAPLQITQAGKSVITSQEYLPTIATLVRACENIHEIFGLPSARQAYLEACRAPSPKVEHSWSHPAVYFAGKASDWFVLATEPEARAFPVFDYHYGILCKRVMKGEALAIATPQAIAAKIERKLSPAQAREQIERLKKELGTQS